VSLGAVPLSPDADATTKRIMEATTMIIGGIFSLINGISIIRDLRREGRRSSKDGAPTPIR